MELTINGKTKRVETARVLAELLAELGYAQSFVAVAVNRACVRRRDFAETVLENGDEIEILAPMAGG